MNDQFAIGRKVRWTFGPNKGQVGTIVASQTMDWGSASLVVLMPDGTYQHVNLKAPAFNPNRDRVPAEEIA